VIAECREKVVDIEAILQIPSSTPSLGCDGGGGSET
jgi:hypothetical protein